MENPNFLQDRLIFNRPGGWSLSGNPHFSYGIRAIIDKMNRSDALAGTLRRRIAKLKQTAWSVGGAGRY